MGMCRLPGYPHHRRIDVKVYKPEHFAFALLSFTGSDHFNRSMRYFAKRKGLSLSDKSLCKAVRVKGEKVHVGDAMPCFTEREIFAALGLEYVRPTERNTYENFGDNKYVDSDDEEMSNLVRGFKQENGGQMEEPESDAETP